MKDHDGSEEEDVGIGSETELRRQEDKLKEKLDLDNAKMWMERIPGSNCPCLPPINCGILGGALDG